MADERRRNASRGGRTGGRGRPAAGVAEIAEIKSDIRRVIDGVAAGTVQNGAVLFMGYNVLLRAVEIGRKLKESDELEGRIEALEEMRDARGGRRWHA